MKICIIASLNFTKQIIEVSKMLKKEGHPVSIPPTAAMINRGEMSVDEIINEKSSGKIVNRVIKQNSIRQNFVRIKSAESVLVLNYRKNGIEYYIGGNTFLEIGFAFILKKKIFILNPIPKMSYAHEIMAMEPIILNNNLNNINGFK